MTWHVWPEHTHVGSRVITVPIDNKAGLFLYGSVHLVSYEKRHHANVYSTVEIKESRAPILWRGHLKSHYLVGESIVQAPDDQVAYKLHYERPYKGEIDIQFHFATNSELPWDELNQVLSGIALSVVSFINIELGDLLTPVAPIQIMKVTQEGLQGRSRVKLLAWNRGTLSTASLQDVVNKYASIFSSEDTLESSGAKLRTALELYAAHFYERPMSTRFLTLVMALEALTPSRTKSKMALDLLEQWKQQVSDLKSGLPQNSDEYSSLEGLERELLFRRENSIRSQIRQHVYSVLSADRHPDASGVAQRAVQIYDRRSTLVHEGTLPAGELPEAEKTAKEIIELVLEAMFRRAQGN